MPVYEEASTDACPECGGRGWVVTPDGGAGRARLCDCRKTNLKFGLLAAANIPERYQHCRLSSFTVSSGSPRIDAQLSQARFKAQRYVNEFHSISGFCEKGLLFMGPPGVGKTHLAVAILVDIIEQYARPGRFVEINSLISQIQGTFSATAPETTQDVINPVLEAPFLVLDELGTQQTTPWVQDILYLIVNTRYRHRLPTIFTTNYRLPVGPEPVAKVVTEKPLGFITQRDTEPKQDKDKRTEVVAPLSSRIPAMLISRLYEMAEPVVMDAVGDYRRDIHGARNIR